MGSLSTGASILTSDSLVSGTLVIVNKSAGTTVTGAALKSDTTLKKSIITPGQAESVVDIGGAGNVATITSVTITDGSWVPNGLSVIDADQGGYLEVVGTNFGSGALAYIAGNAITTSFVDATKLRVTVPSAPRGNYNLMVFNTDNSGTLYSNIYFSIAPTFTTPTGSLGSFFEFTESNARVNATSDSTVTYSVSSGSLPGGVSLSSGNGNISGTFSTVSTQTDYSFVVSAQDVETQANTRSFSITVKPDVVTWTTPANNTQLIALVGDSSENVLVSATSLVNATINYSNVNLPVGLSIVQSNIVGAPLSTGTANVTLIATSALTSKSANLSLSYKIVDPYIIANYTQATTGVTFFGNVAENTTINNIRFSPDGGNLYASINTAAREGVYQYKLNSTWEIFSKTLVGFANVSPTGETNPASFFIGNSGQKLYVGGTTNDRIYEYNLSNPYDISTATLVGNLTVLSYDTSVSGVYFSDDGANLFLAGAAGNDVGVFTVSPAWQINSAVLAGVFVPSPVIQVAEIEFDTTGSKMYLLDSAGTGGNVYQYNLSRNWGVLSSSNVSNARLDIPVLVGSVQEPYPEGIAFSTDGTKLFLNISGQDTAFQLNLSTAWDISTATVGFSGYSGTNHFDTGVESFAFKTDGTKYFVIGSASDSIYEISLSTPWDISTGKQIGSLTFGTGVESNPSGLTFKTDGTKMYLIGQATDRVYEYNLSTAWQANTAVLVGNVSTLGVDGAASDLVFKSDGTKMYVLGSSSDRVYEFNLSTAWQANTAVVVGNVSVLSQDGTAESLDFAHDGTKFAIGGSSTDKVYRYNMSTAWQVNTATSVDSLAMNQEFTSLASLRFIKNGLYFYVGGTTANVSYPAAAEGIFRYIAG